jgi:hypothetical protein
MDQTLIRMPARMVTFKSFEFIWKIATATTRSFKIPPDATQAREASHSLEKRMLIRILPPPTFSHQRTPRAKRPRSAKAFCAFADAEAWGVGIRPAGSAGLKWGGSHEAH